jgi:hypothetical protein
MSALTPPSFHCEAVVTSSKKGPGDIPLNRVEESLAQLASGEELGLN